MRGKGGNQANKFLKRGFFGSGFGFGRHRLFG
jgi:hypothetical protein